MESPNLKSLPAIAMVTTEERERIISSSSLPPEKKGKEEELEEDLLRTPTCVKSKLPSVRSPCPPPAPKKGRRMIGCKRRLTSEFELIGVTAEELERVFGPRDPPVPAAHRGHAKRCKLDYQK